ncbi:MAG: transposase [Ignavibacteriales bacterium]|nr:transposase [Ignavibacteriales bacterium]
MSQYQNNYRIDSTRLKDWDYSTPWWYYVTINTKDHEEYFGVIKNEQMVLNELGKVVQNEWEKTKTLRQNVELDYYVIMPNHVHGIIILNDFNVETCRGKSLQETERTFSKPIKNSLSTIINQFKGSVKRWANGNGYSDFAWQSRFYDRIIRNEKELFNIRKYIEQNPLKWELEKNQPENIFI